MESQQQQQQEKKLQQQQQLNYQVQQQKDKHLQQQQQLDHQVQQQQESQLQSQELLHRQQQELLRYKEDLRQKQQVIIAQQQQLEQKHHLLLAILISLLFYPLPLFSLPVPPRLPFTWAPGGFSHFRPQHLRTWVPPFRPVFAFRPLVCPLPVFVFTSFGRGSDWPSRRVSMFRHVCSHPLWHLHQRRTPPHQLQHLSWRRLVAKISKFHLGNLHGHSGPRLGAGAERSSQRCSNFELEHLQQGVLGFDEDTLGQLVLRGADMFGGEAGLGGGSVGSLAVLVGNQAGAAQGVRGEAGVG